MSSSKKYPWDLILKRIGEDKDIPERLLEEIAKKMKGYFQKSAPKEKNQRFILNDKDALHSYNTFIKECIVATNGKAKYNGLCLKLFPKSIDRIQLEDMSVTKTILPLLEELDFYLAKYSATGSIGDKEAIDRLEKIFQTLKDIFERYTLPELYYGYLYELNNTIKENTYEYRLEKIMNFLQLYYYFTMNMITSEELLTGLREDYNAEEKLAELMKIALLAEAEAKNLEVTAAKAAKEANAADAAYEALIKEIGKAKAEKATGEVIQPNSWALEEETVTREAARQAQKIANIESERQAYLRTLPSYVPQTDQSNWQRITETRSTPTGKIYKADYHEEGICESNFQTLAEKLTEHIQSAHYYSAFLQLERCIQERQKAFNEKQNKNENHENILRGLEHLLQRMKKAPIDKIKTIKFENNRFFRIRISDDIHEDIQIFGGGKRQTRKQKKRNYKKTRKH